MSALRSQSIVHAVDAAVRTYSIIVLAVDTHTQ